MKVFVTGASGWIGSAVVDELLEHGHAVVGLARSAASAASIEAQGAAVLRGDLDDLDALRTGARDADGVVHLANKHDWSDLPAMNRAERASIEALAEELSGSDRPLITASGLATVAEGRLATEEDASPFVGPDSMRGGGENRTLDFVDQGVRAIVARFAPTVHGTDDHGFVAVITEAARRNGYAAYAGDGSSAWSAVHVTDAARLVRLGLEQAPAGTRLHAVAEERVTHREIAEAIGEALGVEARSVDPDEIVAAMGGFIGGFFAREMTASSALTQERYGWTPTGPTLVEDLQGGAYGRA